MKSLTALLILLLTGISSLGALAPATKISEAITASEAYVDSTKKLRSEYYVSSARVSSEADGRTTWHVRYDRNAATPKKGDWFVVVVEMDRKCSMIHGK